MKKIPNLGPVQLKIMQILWNRDRANAKEITEILNKTDPIAHSTVQTLLRQLEDKKVVSHVAEERTFVFYPLIKEHEYKSGVAKDFLGNLFAGSPSQFFAYLFEADKIDADELDKIRAMIQGESEHGCMEK